MFTDVNMPGALDGFQLAQYVQDHHCAVAVIIGSESAALGRRRLALPPSFAEAVFDVGLGQPFEADDRREQGGASSPPLPSPASRL